MGESRIRRGKPSGFFALYRSAAQDVRLSLEARGLFGLMMSLPDDWEFTVSGLAAFSGCGKDRIRRMLKELETVGYLLREQGHDSGGKFSGNDYVLQDEAPPPLSGKPDNGEPPKTTVIGKTDDGNNRQRQKPSTVNPTQIEEDIEREEPPISPKNKKRERQKTIPKYRPEWFERFWAKYPPREGIKTHKKEAAKAWDKLQPSRELCDVMSEALDPNNWPKRWHEEDGKYIPLPSTWLNNERWVMERATFPTGGISTTPRPRPYQTLIENGEEVVAFGP